MTNKIILGPSGGALNLDEVRHVTALAVNQNNASFSCLYKGINNDSSFVFNYIYSDYTDRREDLIAKINNIRNAILRRMNDDKDVTEINGRINLKKVGSK